MLLGSLWGDFLIIGKPNCYNKNTNSEKEVIITKNEKEIKIITCGNVDPEQMSEEERKVLYATLLVRAIELYRKQREEVK